MVKGFLREAGEGQRNCQDLGLTYQETTYCEPLYQDGPILGLSQSWLGLAEANTQSLSHLKRHRTFEVPLFLQVPVRGRVCEADSRLSLELFGALLVAGN